MFISKKNLLKPLFLFLIVLLPTLALAQADPGGDPDEEPEPAPIDGGISLLIAAGIGYGAKKLYDVKKKKTKKKSKL